jgi:hypothetical protein
MLRKKPLSFAAEKPLSFAAKKAIVFALRRERRALALRKMGQLRRASAPGLLFKATNLLFRSRFSRVAKEKFNRL